MGFLKQLFGISEIEESLNKINKKLELNIEENNEIEDSLLEINKKLYASIEAKNNPKDLILSKSKSLEFVDSIDRKAFLSIESVFNKSEFDNHKKNLRPIGACERVTSLFQQFPLIQNIEQAKQLEGAYKVVFPEGAVGKLMKYKNGMLGTPLVNTGGKIGAHAGLVPIESMSINPAMIFGAVSFVTGQYFMAKINKSLESLSKDVKDIITMLLDDKEARNHAIFNFYGYIRENLDLILNNSDLKLATLTNLQSYLVDLNQNILFYEKRINRKTNELEDVIKDNTLTSKRVTEIKKLQEEVTELFVQQHICLELYVIGKIYEMQLAQTYDEAYCRKLVNELEQIIVKAIDFNNNVINEYLKTLNTIEAEALINIDMVENQKNLIQQNIVDRQSYFKENIQATICSISGVVELNRKEQVFIIDKDELYYLEDSIS